MLNKKKLIVFTDSNYKYRETNLLIEIQFHDVCNLNCSYCKLNSGKYILDKKYLDYLLDFIQEKKLNTKFKKVEIMAMGGETFLDLDIFNELIIFFKKLNKIIPISEILLLSNFILNDKLIEKQISKIKKAGFKVNLEISLHAQEFTYNQLLRFYKNFSKFKHLITSVNILEGNIAKTRDKKYLSLYKHIIKNFKDLNILMHNVYICDINKIKQKKITFKKENNILSKYVPMGNLGNSFINFETNELLNLGDINERFIGKKICYCNVQNNIVLDSSGHVRWCGNFDQFQEDVIPNIKMIPENFDIIYDYFFTDKKIKCPYSLCMGGVFKEIIIENN
jgi:sulfatase maturation enzyme AslB (radical SAM superfamily)